MRELLLLAKSFALDESAKNVDMSHVEKATPYLSFSGARSSSFPVLNKKTDQALDVDVPDLIRRAEMAPPLQLDRSVQNLVRRLTAAKIGVRFINRKAVPLPPSLALARRVGNSLSAALKGQPAVVNGCTSYLAGRGEGTTPGLKGVFIFAGPSASGKSMAARLLVEGLGPDYRLWEFDCSQVDSPIERLAFDGSRSAFQGSRPGELTSFVRLNPKTVIVLDHFDRMNPTVQTFLLPLLESGVLKDSFGFYVDDDKTKKLVAPPEVDFRQTYLIINVETGADLYDAPALLDRLLQEGGEPQVTSALLGSLRAARNNLAQPPGPCFAVPVLSRLVSEGVLLFRRLGWDALNAICRHELRLAVAMFNQRVGDDVEVTIADVDATAELLVLAEGGQIDARKVGRETLVNRLFGPVLERWLSEGAIEYQVAVRLGEVAKLELASLREQLGDDPSRTLRRGMKRVDYDLTLEVIGDTLTLWLSSPRLAKIVSGDDYQGAGALMVEAPDVTFADIAGLDNVKASLLTQAALLRSPEKLKTAGMRPPGGALLHGAPGTGKTLLARAFAGEAGLPFIAVTATELFDLKFVRTLFEKLRVYAPAVLFIDELDALGGRTSGTNPALNQLLAEMDGFSSKAGNSVFVIGATNYPQRVDPALLRPGRIELKFEIEPPDRAARRMMLSRIEKHVESGVLESLVDYASGMSGAQMQAACRHIVLAETVLDEHAARSTLEAVVFGERVDYAQGMLETIAWHEAGHAMALIRSGIGRVDYVSLTAREHNAGHVRTSLIERTSPGLRATRARLVVNMAGRVAQRIRFGEEEGVDAGGESDMQSATALAYQAVARWGLDAEIGPMHLPDKNADFELPAMNARVETRVEFWLREAEQQAFTLLKANWHAVTAVAKSLLKNGALAHDKLHHVVDQADKQHTRRQPRPVKKAPSKTIPVSPTGKDQQLA